MRELSADVYNLMKKSNRIHQMTASSLLSNVQSNDEHLEANLCTMLQSVRGSQQYWFVRKSELKCMIREYCSPTLKSFSHSVVLNVSLQILQIISESSTMLPHL